MTKQEMIRYIDAAEGIPDFQKAAAILAVSLMPKKSFNEFSGLADRGLKCLVEKDYDGLTVLLNEVQAPPDVMAAAEALIDAARARD